MPIHGIPLLEYWISALIKAKVSRIYVNSHYKAAIINEYLRRERFLGRVVNLYEEILLGTAGTIRENKEIFSDKPLLLIHADNWSGVNVKDFIIGASKLKETNCDILMLTFETRNPERCGIVRIGEDKVVEKFYEKKQNMNLNLANGAIYYLEKSAVNWICSNNSIYDFSCDVIPRFLGRILTWHNTSYHKDIGSLEMLVAAQKDPPPKLLWETEDEWLKDFKLKPIHGNLKSIHEFDKE